MHDTSFDVEDALKVAPKIADTILKNNFGNYSNGDFYALQHNASTMVAHTLTDALCKLYPEESYSKLSKWADCYAHRAVRYHLQERKRGKLILV